MRGWGLEPCPACDGSGMDFCPRCDGHCEHDTVCGRCNGRDQVPVRLMGFDLLITKLVPLPVFRTRREALEHLEFTH